MQTTSRSLLTAAEVQAVLDVDRSTIYRMAGDGRLPAVRVGRQWRFPAQEIAQMFEVESPVTNGTSIEPGAAAQILAAVAPALGVMMVVTDLDGIPLTPVINPTPWMLQQSDPDSVVADCIGDWNRLANSDDLAPRFVAAPPGFECARAFIRSGAQLVGMVLAGGIAPAGSTGTGFVLLDEQARVRVLDALPRVGALISRFAADNTRSNS